MESYNYHNVIVDLIRIIYQYKEDKIIKKETEDLKSNISKLSQEKLLYFLKKQRLVIFLSEFKSLDLYLPSISKKIKSIAKIQKLNALILAKKTKDIAYIFKRGLVSFDYGVKNYGKTLFKETSNKTSNNLNNLNSKISAGL